MSDLEPRSGRGMTRREREQRAYQLALATGALGLVAVVGVVLAVLTSFSWSWPVIAAVLAVVSFVLFRRTVSGR